MTRRAFVPPGPRSNVKRVGLRAKQRHVMKLWKAAVAERMAKGGHMPGAVEGTIETQDEIAPSVEIDYSKLPTAFVSQSSNKRKDGGDDTENR